MDVRGLKNKIRKQPKKNIYIGIASVAMSVGLLVWYIVCVLL